MVLAQQAALDAREVQLQSHQMEIERLRLLLAKLRRLKLGRKSEQLDLQIEQLELTLEDLELAQATGQESLPPDLQVPAAKPVRRALPPHPPREEIIHAPLAPEHGCACPDCGGVLRRWARMSRKSWSGFPRASRSCGKCAPR
jgi:transposase